ncbi:MAG TPA: class I SAM-dependent methyltransferase [Selenomonadales bacterium]|nr:class I SAM-dependent methyltransferase [Selenomonadales bacterium]
MRTIDEIRELDFESIQEEAFWNTGENRELKMHRIHAYPAKFPAFITTKALDFARNQSLRTERIADVFCGCGTVAFEAKRNNIDFWGCDINPVATMIARTKSQNYNTKKLKLYFESIMNAYHGLKNESENYERANERFRYWYAKKQFEDLARLKKAVEMSVPVHSIYRLFFTCAFSNILKPTSRWLTKSIKPQIDPNKEPVAVERAFETQYRFMVSANEESDATKGAHTNIITANFLQVRRPKVDMIITSPPYVTSYEYADLHQLSSIWLGYAEDYRELRAGSIGSLHHVYNFDRELKRLNKTGASIVHKLLDKDKSKARSVAKYFLDMQRTAKACSVMLSDKGMALFVIGNTEYKGIHIENARHLGESLFQNGFSEVLITKRKISGKILTPYRDHQGRFTTDGKSRKVYGEEFILIGRK